MKILLRPICWVLGHQHTQFKKIKSGNSTLIYGHGDPDNCLRCGKHTPQMMYFSNGQDAIKNFKVIEMENTYFQHKKGCIWQDNPEHMHLVPIDCYVPKKKK